jgi:hypothetical protein
MPGENARGSRSLVDFETRRSASVDLGLLGDPRHHRRVHRSDSVWQTIGSPRGKPGSRCRRRRCRLGTNDSRKRYLVFTVASL